MMNEKNDVYVQKRNHQAVISYPLYRTLMECHEALEMIEDVKVLVDLLFASMNNRSGRKFNKSKTYAHLCKFKCIKALAPKFDQIAVDLESLMDEIRKLEDTAVKRCNAAEGFAKCCGDVDATATEHVSLYVHEFEKLNDFRNRMQQTSMVINFLDKWIKACDSNTKLTFMTLLGNVFQEMDDIADKNKCHDRGDDLITTPDAFKMLSEWNSQFDDDGLYITDIRPSISQQ